MAYPKSSELASRSKSPRSRRRGRQTGFSFLAVEVEPGRHARMKVTTLAESGERIDHFELSRG
ncbi:hypothetical protein [Streptomyces sp. NPDC005181]|uniref:hypothetical protein n=1 Tax=Streptomyces sp. NPDC005181 TaxID=3156869 RepID=UPI0033A41234